MRNLITGTLRLPVCSCCISSSVSRDSSGKRGKVGTGAVGSTFPAYESLGVEASKPSKLRGAVLVKALLFLLETDKRLGGGPAMDELWFSCRGFSDVGMMDDIEDGLFLLLEPTGNQNMITRVSPQN